MFCQQQQQKQRQRRGNKVAKKLRATAKRLTTSNRLQTFMTATYDCRVCIDECIERATDRAVKVQLSITQLGLGGSAVKLFNMLVETVKCATWRGTSTWRIDLRTAEWKGETGCEMSRQPNRPALCFSWQWMNTCWTGCPSAGLSGIWKCWPLCDFVIDDLVKNKIVGKRANRNLRRKVKSKWKSGSQAGIFIYLHSCVVARKKLYEN